MFNFIHNLKLKLGIIKPNLMYLRLKKLYDYTRVCTPEQLDSLDSIDLSHYRAYINPGKEIKLKYLNKQELYFQSALGTVKIKLGYVYPRTYTLEYSNYAGTNVFSITASEKDVIVVPQLNEKLTAESIDLALYELEAYLEEQLGTIEELKQISKCKENFHNEEIEKLK